MMDRDTITRTGARTPGVKRLVRLNGGASAHRVSRLRTRSDVTGSGMHEGRRQTARRADRVVDGKAPSDLSALKPYWGKPAVRDFRESGGNVGIIRSPVRATALPGSHGS